MQHISEIPPLFAIPVRPCMYFKGKQPPKFALGQLIKTCVDQFSGAVDVLVIQGIKADESWLYYCEYLTCIKAGQNSVAWDMGEELELEEIDLDPVTEDDIAVLTRIDKQVKLDVEEMTR
ncbi:MAG: hypothetical protein WBB28_24915 [Crinalium sp.]